VYFRHFPATKDTGYVQNEPLMTGLIYLRVQERFELVVGAFQPLLIQLTSGFPTLLCH